MPDRVLTIGQMSARAGLPISTLHFYERLGLITALRDGANRRVYPRDTLRRVAVIKVAQRAGVTLAEIERALSHLPTKRAPNTADWERLSTL